MIRQPKREDGENPEENRQWTQGAYRGLIFGLSILAILAVSGGAWFVGRMLASVLGLPPVAGGAVVMLIALPTLLGSLGMFND